MLLRLDQHDQPLQLLERYGGLVPRVLVVPDQHLFELRNGLRRLVLVVPQMRLHDDAEQLVRARVAGFESMGGAVNIGVDEAA